MLAKGFAIFLIIGLVLSVPLLAQEKGAEVQFRAAEKTSNFWDAIKAYRQITSQCPQSPWACKAQFHIAQYYYLNGDYKQAREDYKELLRAYPQNSRACEAQYWIGTSFLAEGRNVEARSAFEKALANYPKSDFSVWAQVGLADSYFKEGNYKRAAQEYERVLADHPQSDVLSLVYLSLGESYERVDEPAKAEEAYQRLLEECPFSLEVREARRRISRAASGKYSVQVGAFRDPARANGLASQLRSKGYRVYLLTTEVRGELFHRVRVGMYESRQEAQRILDKLKEQEHLSGRISIKER